MENIGEGLLHACISSLEVIINQTGVLFFGTPGSYILIGVWEGKIRGVGGAGGGGKKFTSQALYISLENTTQVKNRWIFSCKYVYVN